LVALGFEFSTFHLPGILPTTWAIPPALFTLAIF
jgi:hypothetical protein